jgi:predicted enzyme related to lactoylglutathione lyase
MTIQRTRYVLAVPDLEASTTFYRDVLEFTVRAMGDPGWRLFAKDGCHIMAGHCPDAIPPQQLGDHSYFGRTSLVVDDVDDYYAAVVAEGADVTKSLRTEPWGMREFGLRTVDGHRIMGGQDIGA